MMNSDLSMVEAKQVSGNKILRSLLTTKRRGEKLWQIKIHIILDKYHVKRHSFAKFIH